MTLHATSGPLGPTSRRTDLNLSPSPSTHMLLLERLFTRLTDGVLVTDPRGWRVYANPALDAMVGADGRQPLRSSAPPPYVPVDQHLAYRRILDAMARVFTDSGSVSSSLTLVNRRHDRLRADVTVDAFAAGGAAPLAVWLIHGAGQVGANPASRGDRAGGVLVASRPPGPNGVPGLAPQAVAATSELRALTPREHEVLELLLDGWRVLSIARVLFVSEHTVRNHLKAIFRKLGAHSQRELIERLRA